MDKHYYVGVTSPKKLTKDRIRLTELLFTCKGAVAFTQGSFYSAVKFDGKVNAARALYTAGELFRRSHPETKVENLHLTCGYIIAEIEFI